MPAHYESSLKVLADASDKFYSDTTDNPEVQIAIVRVGKLTVGYLYREKGSENWWMYGLRIKEGVEGNCWWRKGDLREILGESPCLEEMTNRVLAYRGYIEYPIPTHNRKEFYE